MKVLVLGADKGLGESLVKMLKTAGHEVIAGVLGEKEDFPEYERMGIDVHHMDVADEKCMVGVSEKLADTDAQIDAVVQVAGVLMKSDRTNTLLTADIDDFMTAFRVNAAGIVIAFRNIYKLMKKGGKYLVITSEAGSFSMMASMFPAYQVTKVASNKVVQTLRSTVDDLEILAIHPGRMNTEMGRTTAQIEPEESAEGIIRVIEGKTAVNGEENWFIDYKGDPMPL